MKYLVTTFFLIAISLVGSTQVDKATEAIKNKQYNKAIALYQAVLDEGKISGEIHYNMGVAYAELNHVGYAIWHFQLAKRAGLDTDDLSHNLGLVKEERKDEIEVIPEFFLAKWWNGWKNLLSSNIWSMIALVFIFGGIYSLYTWRTAEGRDRRKQGFVLGIPLCLIALLCFLSALSVSDDRIRPSQGVLLSDRFDLRSAPDYDSAELLAIHAGVDVEVQDRIGDWLKVRLANGQVGWLPIKEVGLF